MSGLAHVRRLARVDVTRMVRKHTDVSEGVGRVASLLVFVVLALGATLGGGYLAYRVGGAVGTGDVAVGPFSAMAALRGVVAVFGVVGAAVVALRAVGQRGTLTNAEGVLTVVPTREAFLGLLLAEYIYVLLWLGGPAVGVGVGLALGAGAPLAAVTVPLGVAAVGVTTVAVGFPVGLGLKHLFSRIALVARHRSLIVVAAFLAYFAFVVTGSLNAVVVALFEPMQASPTGWAADLMLVGTGLLAPTATRAAAALAVAGLLAALAAAVGTRIAAVHWFSDPVLAGKAEPDPDEESPAEPGAVGSASGRLQRRLALALGRPTAALVLLAWRRAARAPLKLLYVAYPLFFAVGVFADIVQTGRIPGYLPYGTVLFVAWAAGVVFTLNPLGDQGAGLPTALLSRVDGRQFVRAHVVASLVVAVPLGTVLTAAVAVLSPLDATTTLGLVAASPVLVAVATVLSVGIGTAFPRFRAVNVTRSMKTVVPSTLAFALFSLHLVLTVASALVVADEGARTLGSALLTLVLPFGLGVDPETLFLVAAGLLAVLVVAPALSYRYAVRRFDRYTLD